MSTQLNAQLLVSPEALRENISLESSSGDALLVVDTRGKREFNEGHIPGAVNLPSGDLFDAQSVGSDLLPREAVERRVREAGIDNETPLVFYDDSGLVPSARVFWVLENFGRGNMALLDGGFPVWTALGFPVATEVTPIETGTFRADAEGMAFATREQVRSAIDRDDIVLVDTRTSAEYAGAGGAHTRNGHIPGAVNVDWQHHIEDLFNPRFVEPAKLRSLYDAVGVTPDREVITYCRTASRSSHTYFVLRLLGFPRVSNYSGSWTEWNVDETLPIATGEKP